MHSLFSGFVPIWVLTAAGYLVGRAGLLGEQAEAVLGRFVFHVAMPASLFAMLERSPLGAFGNSSMIAFAAGTALTSLLGALAARRLFGRGPADQAIAAMAAGYVNSANLGIPVAVQVLGDASFIVPVLLFQVLLVSPAVLAVLDSATATSGGGARTALRRMVLLPVRNPIIMAAALGCLASATGFRLPGELDHSCQVLGGAAVPTALVTLGLSLHGRRPATGTNGRAEVGLQVVLKTLVQPLVAYAVGALLLGLPPHQLLAVVICSALPTAQNVYIYAQQYRLDTALARDSVLISTLVSMATLSGIAWALGGRG
ncbi:AEC family transporter [Kitasatospora sp. NPDC052896]|uniref:AEC family transporter n=1 Tax=Kitasatospora sp. NPDC052896 TaxID=3364061 RepID=UPI0037C8A275